MASKKATKKKSSTYNIKCTVKDSVSNNGNGGAFYFLGFVAALIYYVTTAPTFWDAVIGFLKAIVWPAFLVFGAFQFLAL